MAYMDAAQDRLDLAAEADLERAIVAVRAGTIFAHDRRAWSRWLSRPKRHPAAGGRTPLSGVALERAVLGLARRNPEYVVMGAG